MDERHRWEGGCHCGAVRFRIETTSVAEVLECNCSICTMKGFLHMIVPGEDFTLLRGEEVLTTYTFNTGQAKHYFCSVCGVASFYVPRSHPDGFSINARCIDGGIPDDLSRRSFDGRNWEANIETIR
ncbi:MAG: GFA family protein [Myxococcota bacterium]